VDSAQNVQDNAVLVYHSSIATEEFCSTC